MSNDSQIQALIDDWARAVRMKDMAGVLANHADDIVMFDVPMRLSRVHQAGFPVPSPTPRKSATVSSAAARATAVQISAVVSKARTNA